MEQFSNSARTTMSGAINNSQTTLVVADASSFPSVPQFRIRIDNEIMKVTGVSGTTFTVIRAAESVAGTTLASTHADGALVQAVLSAGAIAAATQNQLPFADTDGATITFDLSVSNKHTVTLGGNRTLALANDFDGQTFTIELTQDGTGSRTVTWWSGIRWPGGSAPTLTTTINKTDIFAFERKSSGVYFGYTVGLNF